MKCSERQKLLHKDNVLGQGHSVSSMTWLFVGMPHTFENIQLSVGYEIF